MKYFNKKNMWEKGLVPQVTVYVWQKHLRVVGLQLLTRVCIPSGNNNRRHGRGGRDGSSVFELQL